MQRRAAPSTVAPAADPGAALLGVADELSATLGRLSFGPPVAHVYDPTTYAREAVAAYLDLARVPCDALFLGMNPGPWGMAQTGVPFGAVPAVRDWLGIERPVGKPAREHPAKPVTGFACRRVEVSGARLWGWAQSAYGSPAAFFERCFVVNYCPLLFLDAGGRNLTPDKLAAAEREPLLAACDEALIGVLQLLAPRVAVGIGAFAAARLRTALAGAAQSGNPLADVRVGQVLHPSPASPAANRGWETAFVAGLAALGVSLPTDPHARAARPR